MLFIIAFCLIHEAAPRLVNPHEIVGWTMIIFGTITFIEDSNSVWAPSKNQGSLKMTSAFLHMIADVMATVGVIVGGIPILRFNSSRTDPVITAAIAIYILVSK